MFQDIAHFSKLSNLYSDALDVNHVSHCMPAGEAVKAESRMSFRGESTHVHGKYGPSVFVNNFSGYLNVLHL
jgi:hypothetical protein